jgi:hypothetical protein
MKDDITNGPRAIFHERLRLAVGDLVFSVSVVQERLPGEIDQHDDDDEGEESRPEEPSPVPLVGPRGISQAFSSACATRASRKTPT